MAPASPPPLQYAIRKPHSRSATWVWLGSMLALGFGLPMLMTANHGLQLPAGNEAWLEMLTICANELGRALQHSLVMIAWAMATIVLSAPGFLTRSATVQRLHAIGAALAIATLVAFAASLHLAVHKPEPSISSQSPPDRTATNGTPPRPR